MSKRFAATIDRISRQMTFGYSSRLWKEAMLKIGSAPIHLLTLIISIVLVLAPGTIFAALPKDGWSLVSVDSQELVGEDGAAVNAFDGDPATIWHTEWSGSPDPPHPHEIVIDLGQLYDINGFTYLPRQDNEVNGRIIDYAFYVGDNPAQWPAATASGVFENNALEKTVSFPPTAGRYIRLVAFSEPNGKPFTSAAEIGVSGTLFSGNQPPDGVILSPSSAVSVMAGDTVFFSGAGSDPDGDLPLSYLWRFGDGSLIDDYSLDGTPGDVRFDTVGVYTVTLTVTDALGASDPVPAAVTVTVLDPNSAVLPKDGWSLVSVDSQELVGEDGAAVNAFDGDPATIWHTEWSGDPDPTYPHEIVIDLGQLYDIDGFTYLPRQDRIDNGNIADYRFYVGLDPKQWPAAAASGVFENNAQEKTVSFPPTAGRYIRLVALTGVNSKPWTTAAEIGVSGVANPGNIPPDGVITTPSNALAIQVGDSVDFSGLGTDPDFNFPLTYEWDFGEGSGIPGTFTDDPDPVVFSRKGTYVVSLTVGDNAGRRDTTPDTLVVKVFETPEETKLPPEDWTLLSVDSEELVGEDGRAVNAFDGDPASIWHTEWSGDPDPTHPHEIQIDLGSPFDVDTLSYLPRQDGSDNGRIENFRLYASSNGVNWQQLVLDTAFLDNAVEKQLRFAPVLGQFFRIVSLSAYDRDPWASAAEIGFEGVCETPSTRLIQPLRYHLQEASSLEVMTSTCLDQFVFPNYGVKIEIDGGLASGGDEIFLYEPPFRHTFTDLNPGEHEVGISIVDEAGEIISGDDTQDQAAYVATGGDYYVAIGDSITVGVGDDLFSDDISFPDGRNIGGGFTPILNTLLTQRDGRPVTVEMEGVAGEESFEGLERLPSVLSRHPTAEFFLLLYGTNDAGGLFPRASGLGLQSTDPLYMGTYKDIVQAMIDLITDAGKEVYLAKIPFTLSESRNAVIEEYNMVIDELIDENAIGVEAPDLYTYFENHQEQLMDTLHPNGQGYAGMAEMWLNVLP
ncbi:MAG: discoidin domain-containing protein [Desulfobacterales bacterium]